MLSLTPRRKFSSTMAGGGVFGTGVGIAPGITTLVGFTIKGSHPFIREYRPLGGTTTETTVGLVINGTTSGFRINKSSVTGATGKKTGIGRSSRPGASKV
jgi:hypothetical protein